MSGAPGSRLSNLDYLRGLAALGILAYHYTSWTTGPQDAQTPLGRIGIYGVAIFYVLSGLTMYHVYATRIRTLRQIRTFFVRRAFRIFPLLWLVSMATIVLAREWPEPMTVILNFTGLFGFVDWDGYIALGAWSIGNELFFYALFPLLALTLRRRWAFWGAVILFFMIGAFFAFSVLDAQTPLSEQWSAYVNPLNQSFLFVAGVGVGKLLRDVSVPRWALIAVAAVSILIFVAWPSGEGQISLVTGVNRFVFSAACVALCAVAYKLAVDAPGWIDRPLGTLGEASYSVYLLHPIMFTLFSIVLRDRASEIIVALVALVATLLGSVLCYRLYERPLTDIGRRLTPTRS
ncbi:MULTISPECIES: acyltransferase [unclassified Microbacterium]|uniref:acyltransferase family protein n=1 Tax=unclassified Microbacterium TaxID=2609290 RepID=UPI000EAA8B62|nr:MULTISPECIES: acyltransferase [unclassified Microbacterium]MBT2485509.1 acyltransferase [Microbacterium sp. ISL-108]RKN68299.1 acyltransferase [Microbacterium sp. CGR2]